MKVTNKKTTSCEPDKALSIKEETAEESVRNIGLMIYNFISLIGDKATTYIVKIYRICGSFLHIPKKFLFFICRTLKELFTHYVFCSYLEAGNHLKTLWKEFTHSMRFRKNHKSPHTAQSFKENCVKAYNNHRKLFATSFNTALPAAALIALIFTVSYWGNVTVALEVNLEQKHLGYVSDESVYDEAERQVRDRIGGAAPAPAENSASAQPQSTDGKNAKAVFLADKNEAEKQTVENVLQQKPSYKLSVVSIDELVDADTLCDKILETSNSNITNACGIYINDEFICAVKNETDAKSVFDNILEQKRANAPAGSIIDFVEEIEFVQGLYADNTGVIWSTEQLQQKLSGTKSKAVHHIVQEGEVPSSIAQAYNLTTAELIAMNPWLEEAVIHVGDSILVSNQVNFLQIKEMRTAKRQEPIKFESEEKETTRLYVGKTRVKREGKDGLKEITEMQTIIDGVVTETKFMGEKVLTDPVNEIIEVGTKSKPKKKPSSGSSGGSSGSNAGSAIINTPTGGKFAWPAPGCNTITAGWYYSSGRYHGAIDLASNNGSAGGRPVVAADAGTVIKAGWDGSHGYRVMIDHGGGLVTSYSHMQKGSISVKVGQKVKRGQTIGRVGSTGNSTGNHLHFEVHKNGKKVNPRPYLGL